MTTAPGRLRRFFEWLWRGQRLKELKHQSLGRPERAAFQDAKACHLLAWRVVGGLEPLPASARPTAARPLLLTAVQQCLPLLQPGPGMVAELFDDSGWQERLSNAGVSAEQQASVKQWLVGDVQKPDQAVAEAGVRVVQALLEAVNPAERAIRRLRWRRVAVLATIFALVAALTALIVSLTVPPARVDIAAKRPWRASSAYVGYVASGSKPVAPDAPAFFCTNEDNEAWWIVDLQAPTRVDSATIVNRADCCLERATPLVLEVSVDNASWREVSRRTELFRTWKPTFAPVSARYVRLRALRKTFLHMKDVQIHTPGR